jgi:enterochelin esterase-like enzyme
MKTNGNFHLTQCLLACALIFGWTFNSNAQQAGKTGDTKPNPRPSFFMGPQVVSPQINSDNTVTFRLLAPKATEVMITGEWMPGFGRSEPMVKNDTGMWTITLGPLMPEFYGYSFTVNGVKVLDPSNPQVKRDGTRNDNVLLVPGKESELYQVKDVPHGMLSKVWYNSPVLGLSRRVYIYTPPGYESGKAKYPVLYLLHGAGGDEDAWTTLGRACQILDNLIAQGKAVPMLVVMTNGNSNQAASPGEAPEIKENAAASSGPGGMLSGKFEESLVKDVVPFIEKHYRVVADKDHRAIAGLSMGGFHTQNITNANPKMFSYIGVMSMGLFNPKQFGGEDNTALIEKQLDVLKLSGVKLYWIGCGKDDFLYKGVADLRAMLDKHQFKYTYRESTGGHTWANWRIYLSELAPLLFK